MTDLIRCDQRGPVLSLDQSVDLSIFQLQSKVQVAKPKLLSAMSRPSSPRRQSRAPYTAHLQDRIRQSQRWYVSGLGSPNPLTTSGSPFVSFPIGQDVLQDLTSEQQRGDNARQLMKHKEVSFTFNRTATPALLPWHVSPRPSFNSPRHPIVLFLEKTFGFGTYPCAPRCGP